MKNTGMIAILALLVVTGAFAPGLAWASPGYGAAGAATAADSDFTVGVMLSFALQDEYMARSEHQKTMAKFAERCQG